MHRNISARKHRTIFALCLLAVLALAACASGAQGQAQSTPTATAAPLTTLPPTHVLSLGGYRAGVVLPGKAGLLLYPWKPFTPSNTLLWTADHAMVPSLSFYRYSTGKVETLATAPAFPEGQDPGSIRGAAYAGDWVTYLTDDLQDANWTLWAYNVVTKERLQVDSAAHSGAYYFHSSWVATASDLVWSIILPQDDGSYTTNLYDYSYATRQMHLLYTRPKATIVPRAMNSTTILLSQQADGAQGPATWLLKLGESAPRQIEAEIGSNVTMNDHYIVWDDVTAQQLSLYNLVNGVEERIWAHCIRPAIDATLPYVACLNSQQQTFYLEPVPQGGGDWLPFAQNTADLGSSGAIYNGRVFWVVPAKAEIDYFDLPTQ